MMLEVLSQAVAAAPKAVASAVANTSGGEGVTLTAMGIGLSYVQRYLKTFGVYQKFVAAFPGANKWAHRIFAATVSLLVAIGFSYSFDYDAAKGGQIIIAVPALASLVEGGKHWVWMFLMQQYAYDSTKDGVEAPIAPPVPAGGV